MSKPLAGTKTEKNLWTAFAGESQARNKYDYFAGVARKEGFQQIAAIFEETASNEKAHAKIWFKELQGIGNTAENLKAAASGEHYEWTDIVMWQCRECGNLVIGPRAPEICPVCSHPQAYFQLQETNF